MEENITKDDEIRLIKQRSRGFLRLIFSRTGIVMLLLLLAVAFVVLLMTKFAGFIEHVLGIAFIFNLVVIIRIMITDMDSTSKITWLLVIAATSVFGAIFYLYTKADIGTRTMKKKYEELSEEHRKDIVQDPQAMESLRQESPQTASLVHYLNRHATFPVSMHNDVTYYPLGEYAWADMLEELKKAEKFIFMEYFIVDEGEMWGKILKILKDKADQGVDVRVMYDGTCVMSTLPYGYPEMVEKLGIQCAMFCPPTPFVTTLYNYRDHRKILVIDGKVGFTGGINLADEYINATVKYGHWKDTALRVKGAAVNSLTLMFLNMWYYGYKVDYSPYINQTPEVYEDQKGYVIPYGVNPFDRSRLGERVYMDIINSAHSYVHIMTPYLILDDEMLQALKYAAERGVDVKLILPGIPDKKGVYALAKTYFASLIASGVEIYIYTEGFVHAKVFVSDDIKGVVGTVNLDYRSLYHHYECAAYMYDVPCLSDVEKDVQETLKKCYRYELADVPKEKLSVRIQGSFMRLIAPLL